MYIGIREGNLANELSKGPAVNLGRTEHKIKGQKHDQSSATLSHPMKGQRDPELTMG
jgi:hypothetical protein